ncbi:hypothetical protein C8R46DRAFT_1188110 [Mycena filopes]|nr:hypothetical protein C8R46DRAFT_1346242 [Mycena filopes]KAJ7177971.1 hypothetical protein C8R46DRAFT_1188110 [Mycena filopes]
MFTKFITIAVLFGAPLLSAAAPAPGLFNPATVTIFRCPASASASASAVSSGAVVVPSATAAPVAGGGGTVVPGNVVSQAANLLTALRSIGDTVNGIASTLTGLETTVNGLLNTVAAVLNGVAGPVTNQVTSAQNQANSAASQLNTVASSIGALTSTLNNLGNNGASNTNGGDIFTAAQNFLNNLSSATTQVTNVVNAAAQGSGVDPDNLQDAIQSVLNQCIIVMPDLSSQCATAAQRQLIANLWNVLRPRMAACANGN